MNTEIIPETIEQAIRWVEGELTVCGAAPIAKSGMKFIRAKLLHQYKDMTQMKIRDIYEKESGKSAYTQQEEGYNPGCTALSGEYIDWLELHATGVAYVSQIAALISKYSLIDRNHNPYETLESLKKELLELIRKIE